MSKHWNELDPQPEPKRQKTNISSKISFSQLPQSAEPLNEPTPDLLQTATKAPQSQTLMVAETKFFNQRNSIIHSFSSIVYTGQDM